MCRQANRPTFAEAKIHADGVLEVSEEIPLIPRASFPVAFAGLVISGPNAHYRMRIAQCFAGWPNVPPARGERHIRADASG